MSQKRTTIDLTGGDENEHRNKQPRSSSQVYASQPRASQSLNSTQQTGRDAWGGAEPDEAEEIIDLSQDNEESSGWVCVGGIDTKIVGLRYYNGYASVGEIVMVRREPSNPYDSNAIRINNVQGTQIGHIPRTVAAKLAPYMDSKSIVTEGMLASQSNGYECSLKLKVYGPGAPDARAALEARMKADRVPIKKQGIAAPKATKKAVVPDPPNKKPQGYTSSQSSQPGPSSSVPELLPQPELGIEHFVQNSERFNPRDAEKLVEAWGAGEDALSKMPMADQPKKLQSTLLPYQLQALKWMLEKENPVVPPPGSADIIQLWKRVSENNNAFQNIATQFQTKSEPVLARGGILADDMGLGKTLEVISVILEGGQGPTLILAPVSVMSNWTQQIERHIKKEFALNVLTYHGSNRRRLDHEGFAKYDVVISTYGTLSTEYMPGGAKSPAAVPRKEGLFSVNWGRVVLDEGHTIRNHATKAAVAATALLARCRWVLSGTPIV